MFWLPVAFVCFFGNKCGFFQGGLSVSERQCVQQNTSARMLLQADKSVEVFQLDCLIIQLKSTDAL